MPRRHLIITGTGRAGTTLLVQLMTTLGMNTGFEDTSSGVFAHCQAGMERDLRDPDCPYVVKDPRLCYRLDAILRDGIAAIDHAIVPVRDLYSAAESRRAVSAKAGVRGADAVAGGLWLTSAPDEQEAVLAAQFYRLMDTLTRYDVPTTLLQFPRFVSDPDYLFRKLSPVLPDIGAVRFRTAFNQVVRPDLVHDFELNATRG
jgi:hypothetical protein